MMATTEQPPSPPPAPSGPRCANCSAPLAADQRYCLNCGARAGAPRVAPQAAPTEVIAEPVASRPADVSPLAAVIGIALLGGMLLIGVLIGREAGGDETTPAPVVQVEQDAQTTTPATGGGQPVPEGESGAISSEWPEGTDGWTIQLNTVPKDGATPESVQAAKEAAASQGATDAAVLDSDLYPSLPPGIYLIYSGVYTDRKSAEEALKPLTGDFPSATVVEVSKGGAPAPGGGAGQPEQAPPEAGGAVAPEDQLSPEVGGTDQ